MNIYKGNNNNNNNNSFRHLSIYTLHNKNICSDFSEPIQLICNLLESYDSKNPVKIQIDNNSIVNDMLFRELILLFLHE